MNGSTHEVFGTTISCGSWRVRWTSSGRFEEEIVYKNLVFPVAFLAGFYVAIQAGSKGWEAREVPARHLPVPLTVSPQMQALVAKAPNYPQTQPPPKSDREWIKMREEFDRGAIERARKDSARLSVTYAPMKISGVNCFHVKPAKVKAENEKRLLVHLHGGGYVVGSGEAGLGEAVLVAAIAQAEVISIDYRMPPEHPFPAALEDSVAVWTELTRTYNSKRMALFGTSAGGGLTMATVLKLKELGLPLPGALFMGTPWTDLSKTGDTYFTNAVVDNVLVEYDGIVEAFARLYAGKEDLKNPLISPVYGDHKGFPPTILVSGTRDLFLSTTVRAHRSLRRSGVRADLHVFEGQSHAQYLTDSPESEEALEEIAEFFNEHLAK
ncbi:MAG: alpha/beta hydrolase [Bdellovibrionales bacterium]